jgi:hypothetical protein
MEYSASTLNELFVEKLNSPAGLEKVAMEGSAFVRQKLREVSFARKIINPQYVTKADLTRSVNHDGLVKIVDIEPDSEAMALNMRGQPNLRYVMGDRFEIPLYQVSSEDFQKTEEELLAYEMPLTDIIEKNSVLDLQRIEDEKFLEGVDALMPVANAKTGSYRASGSETGVIEKSSLKELFDVLDGAELRCDTLLMDSTMYNRLFLYDASTIGDSAGSEIYINGFTYNTLFGRKVVVSNKVFKQDGSTALLQNKIYAFAPQEFLGQFLVLNDTKFWIEKKKNIITWAVYEHIGIGFGNSKALAKLTLS